ncbi:MAG: flagellar hook-length control protein FliK [Proteobacteria bacterium]|nr:flagellar hook-length control protein FliK [Pseudomonadota bacterium]
MMVNPLITSEQRESAVTKLLASLTAGTAPTSENSIPVNAPPPAPQIPASVPAKADQSSAAQLAGDSLAAESAAKAADHQGHASGHAADSGKGPGAASTAGIAVLHVEQGAEQHQGTVATPTGQQADGQWWNSATMIIQNKFGQMITIRQEKGVDEEIEANNRSESTATTADKHPVDVNGNYIRSHLPKDPANTTSDSRQNFQADSALQAKQQKPSLTAETMKSVEDDGQKTQSILGQETSSLLFASQPQGIGPQPATTPIASVALHLPSGMMVPDAAVVDQMIAHFSANKQLENSTVILRLYPEELGELRMEIKVAQDNIKAHIVVQNPLAQEMIDRHLPRLREALEQQGLQLQQVEVSVAAHGQTGGGERFHENNAWRQQVASQVNSAASQSDFTHEIEEIVGIDTAANTLSVLV